jgi:NAD dependent epimerase/dehydratase family enzyme
MRVLVAGSSGYIGSALVSHLRASGTEVHRVLRSPAGEGDAYYDASRHTVDLSRVPGGSLEGFDAVYAIGGVPLTPRRWGQRKRDAIHASRVEVVDALARAVARTDGAPPALIAMSAIGIYGERGDEELTEGRVSSRPVSASSSGPAAASSASSPRSFLRDSAPSSGTGDSG